LLLNSANLAASESSTGRSLHPKRVFDLPAENHLNRSKCRTGARGLEDALASGQSPRSAVQAVAAAGVVASKKIEELQSQIVENNRDIRYDRPQAAPRAA
jgi:hypothetical protein